MSVDRLCAQSPSELGSIINYNKDPEIEGKKTDHQHHQQEHPIARSPEVRLHQISIGSMICNILHQIRFPR